MSIEIPRQYDFLPNIPEDFSVQEVLIAGNKGTCGGVEMSLAAVKQVMDVVPQNVDVWTTNTPVNFPPAFERYGGRLKSAGGNISGIPDRSILIISAHGSPPSLYQIAREKDLFVIDTTCAVVAEEQKKVRETAAAGIPIVYLGEENHPETIGIRGQVSDESIVVFDPTKPIPEDAQIPSSAKIFVKTTNDPARNDERIGEIKSRGGNFDESRVHPCYALTSRYAAGKALVKKVDYWLVIGNESSNNARGLRKLADTNERTIPSALVGSPEEINWSDFTKAIKRVGITAAASAPDEFIERVLDTFRQLGVSMIELPQVIKEAPRTFRLPKAQLEALQQRFA